MRIEMKTQVTNEKKIWSKR